MKQHMARQQKQTNIRMGCFQAADKGAVGQASSIVFPKPPVPTGPGRSHPQLAGLHWEGGCLPTPFCCHRPPGSCCCCHNQQWTEGWPSLYCRQARYSVATQPPYCGHTASMSHLVLSAATRVMSGVFGGSPSTFLTEMVSQHTNLFLQCVSG